MPLSCSTTPANSSEREQVMSLLNNIVVKNNQPGRPRIRVKVLAADKGYDSKVLRAALCVNVVSDHSCQNEHGRQRKKEKSGQTNQDIRATFSTRTMQSIVSTLLP